MRKDSQQMTTPRWSNCQNYLIRHLKQVSYKNFNKQLQILGKNKNQGAGQEDELEAAANCGSHREEQKQKVNSTPSTEVSRFSLGTDYAIGVTHGEPGKAEWGNSSPGSTSRMEQGELPAPAKKGGD